jgi:hypothetical protein
VEIKSVAFPRPRDSTDPAVVHLAAEVKLWLRQQIFADNRAENAESNGRIGI